MQRLAGSRSGRSAGGRPCVLWRNHGGISSWKEDIGDFYDSTVENETREQGNQRVHRILSQRKE